MRVDRSLAVLLVALGLAACATPGPILTESVGTIRAGLGEVREQSALAFGNVNDTALQIDVARVLQGPAPNLREEDFPLAIGEEERAKWSSAFDVLDDYLAALQALVAPERAAATSTQLDGIANQLRGGNLGLQLPGAATAAFSTFAGALVQAKEERTATMIMRRVDPAFQEVMAGMADAIGPDDRTGLRQTVRLYWQGKFADIRASYVAITGNDAAATDRRRAVVGQFVKAMRDRDADLRDLAAMRTSMLALGAAHTAAAKGSSGDALFWIGRIGGWLDDIKTRTAAAKP